jgi:hypothetical protein
MLMTLVWPTVQAAAVASRQRAKLSELEQTRALWEAQPFASYRLLIQLPAYGGSVCEKAFEVHEPAQIKTLSDTCDSRDNYHVMNVLGDRTSVPGLFDYIKTEIGHVGECGPNGCACDGGRTIDVVYDTGLGYPKRVGEGLKKDWTTQSLPRGCTAMGPLLPSPFTVSVNPIE